jgi:DNA-binding transcriptional ArsR family regulator
MTRHRHDAFRAISDPSRRRILLLLSKQSLTINSLVQNFRMSRPAVSRHIKILETSGFISIRDVGRERYCTLKQEGFADVERWMQFYDVFWKSKLKSLDSLLSDPTPKK